MEADTTEGGGGGDRNRLLAQPGLLANSHAQLPLCFAPAPPQNAPSPHPPNPPPRPNTPTYSPCTPRGRGCRKREQHSPRRCAVPRRRSARRPCRNPPRPPGAEGSTGAPGHGGCGVCQCVCHMGLWVQEQGIARVVHQPCTAHVQHNNNNNNITQPCPRRTAWCPCPTV
jgi:hypothetical protein